VPRQKPLSSLPPRPVARQSQPFRVSAAALWVIGLTSAGALGWSVLNRTNVVPTMGGPGAATLAVSSGQAPTASGPGNEADKLYQQGKQLGKSSNPKDRKQGVEMLRQAAKLGSSAARALVTKQSMPFGRLPAKELPSPVGTAPSHASDPQTENPAAEDRPGRFVSIYDN